MKHQQTEKIQHWLKDVITGAGNLNTNTYRATVMHRLYPRDVVAVCGPADVEYRLMVYSSGYLLRLMECLAADFPVLKKFLGDELFYLFAGSAIAAIPSRSYTLADLGMQFIQFMEQTRPERGEYNFNLPVAIARLERTLQEVIRMPGHENDPVAYSGLPVENILLLADAADMTTSACIQLVETGFKLQGLFQPSLQDTGEAGTWPEEAVTFIAVSRKDYRIIVEEIPDWQYHLLNSVSHGRSIRQALKTSAGITGRNEKELLAELYFLLPGFIQKGFLIRR